MKSNELIKLTMFRDTWVDMEVSQKWLDILLFPIFILMIVSVSIIGYPILIFKKLFAQVSDKENHSQQPGETPNIQGGDDCTDNNSGFDSGGTLSKKSPADVIVSLNEEEKEK